MTERRLGHHEANPEGTPGCPQCDGEGIDLGAFRRFDIRVVCACVDDSTPGCKCTKPDRALCNGCGHAWCERCDPTPSALCHWCHGRGHSTAELEPVEPCRSIVMPSPDHDPKLWSHPNSFDRTSIFSHSGDDPSDWRVVASVEGWGWFNDCEIQRDDERNEFASDLHATMHVITRAVADEESPHMAFLKFWRAEAPEAYMDTMCAILGSIPGFSIIDERAKMDEIEAGS